MDLVIIECQLLFQILLRYKLCIVTSSNTYIFFQNKMPKDESEKNYRTQQYRPVWEVEVWAKGWLIVIKNWDCL